ncbi:MAG: ATP-binding protein [Candidatus Paceibacterota bacterium]
MKENIEQLVLYLIGVGHETEYLEFKENFDKETVGERISAIANSCAVLDREFGYIIFGINDKTLEIVGTNFNVDTTKEGNMPIENWLQQFLEPKASISFYECFFEKKRVVVLKIRPAIDRPVSFRRKEWIRIGEVTRALSDFPEKEKRIWNNHKNRNYEKFIVLEDLKESEVLNLLEYDKYFQLTKQNLPTETRKFLEKMSQDGLVVKQDVGTYKITFLGAILFARNIQDIKMVSRKTIRVIKYVGNNKAKRESDKDGTKGYAIGFEGLIEYINTLLPGNEEIKKALRVETKTYPEVAIREFVANALIHQDFSIDGTGPMIEIFDNRIEITNPGIPLIEIDRFIDHPPRSRNENLASIMRRFGFCEESGSGIDRALVSIELFQLPAPKFETYDNFTRVTLFAPLPLNNMTDEDKIRACYQHCVLKHLTKTERMTNTSLRERLGIPESNYPAASRIIRMTLNKSIIREAEKAKEYLPWWA